ncbi:hypothetical protein A3D81_02750 [Candidatus Curtissbacteria bacterium RIFCSPHIGHO2_02_FULL_40_17]|uniref:Fido domain-containing protein n=4 Tax=Candidatus Curtissiibacteriota TaxID=1752717 RepID=A0A1F5GHC8_9BACT|nr:MAG: hypothetical protein A2693_00335 [Candidatus Curtissbacteria bacterium RIFCSPHIGHO2_01_FULL_40_12]OGD91268.1 MAG: hypothetical protein A3D81_02750 [Candidatus Curtissbacteria bacterium RIFCSPHIGHO2_02_FULL_40_17]OGE03536.1 MAG: hypothetical protein A3F45_00210 [Candidatus Curtissbacteria bacterium RIFCSPHIGHO2_12_FULL_41_17]OGE09122.1 MAG: hypothetical protein A3I53_04005 [Candidatus Curtissbacteria bacterium RIFCSPLOWO2_02_FULL_40_13b]
MDQTQVEQKEISVKEKPLKPEEKEFAERGERIDEIVNYFNSPAAAASHQQLLQEQDPEKKRIMLDQMADRINTLSTGKQQPKFLESTKIAIEGIDQEWGVDWQPPRPADVIYEAYINKAADLIAAGDIEGAAATMFQAVNLIHPYQDGNGRTSRLLYLYMQDPDSVKNPSVVDAFLRMDYRRGKSREASSHNLTSAFELLKRKYGVDRLPLLRFKDGQIANMGLGNQLRSMAHVMLGGEARHADNLPVVVDYTNLAPEEAAKLEEKTNALRKELLLSLLDLSEERQVVTQKMRV